MASKQLLVSGTWEVRLLFLNQDFELFPVVLRNSEASLFDCIYFPFSVLIAMTVSRVHIIYSVVFPIISPVSGVLYVMGRRREFEF